MARPAIAIRAIQNKSNIGINTMRGSVSFSIFPGVIILLREALLTLEGAVKIMFLSVRRSVRIIIVFCQEYMNPGHMLLSIGTLKS